MKSQKSKLLLSASLSFVVISLLFSNCSQNLSTDLSSTDASSASAIPGSLNFYQAATVCEQNLKAEFQGGYYQFSRTNCIFCHQNGPGKGRFAGAGLEDAYNDFMQIGYAKVSDNAISSAHQPPYSGPQHIQQINQLRVEWQQSLTEYAQCSGTSIDQPKVDLNDIVTLETKQQTVGTVVMGAKAKEFTWSLTNDLMRIKGSGPLPVLPNASFSIQLGKYQTSGGETYYTFTKPRIFGSTTDINVKTLQVKINGRILNYPTTFRFVDKGIYKGSVITDNTSLVSTGSLAAPGALSSADQISVVFESIEPVTLPKAPDPVQVNFSGSNARLINATTGFADVDVVLSSPPEVPVTVSVSSDNVGICGSTSEFAEIGNCNSALANFICTGGACMPARMLGRARSIVGATYNRYDWDYKFTGSSLTFGVGETTKTIRVTFSKDTRRENNRLFTLQIDSSLAGAVRGSNYQVNFVINKLNNPAPVVGVPTFTQLMNASTGILGVNCVKCHNSKDLNGGYDMTNYDLMRSRGVIIPGQIESLMYGRMNPNSAQYSVSNPMPIEGQLPVDLRKDVEKWILGGAPNN